VIVTILFLFRSIGSYHLNSSPYHLFTHIFLAFGTSSVDVSKDMLKGRPYVGTGILYHRSLAEFIKVVDTNNARLTTINSITKEGPILLVNVYMPVDYGTVECTESYMAV